MVFLVNAWRGLVCLAWLSIATAAVAAADSDASGLIQLGPGDSVKLEVYGQPDLTSSVYVDESGKIKMPLGEPVVVSGMSPVAAARAVEVALKKGGFLNDPHVTVTLVKSPSQRIAVLGEVHTPGQYTLDPKTTVFDLLAQAGGQTENAADFVYVLRPDEQGAIRRFTVKLSGLSGADGTITIEHLQGGDKLVVPHAEQFYIYGEVTTAAMYRLQPEMTVLEAIARAGGITPRGSERRIDIKRPGKDGHYQVFHAKLNDRIQPDDVIHVKESIF
jgi:polysaccharide export outer membrane protein